MKYEVIYKGKSTGIITKDKKISLSILRKKFPQAQPFDKIEFKPK